MFQKILLSILISSYTTQAIANNTSTASKIEKIYIINKNAICQFKTNDNTSYCVDKDKNPITGEVRKYIAGEIIQSFNVKDSLIEGEMKGFYLNGNKKNLTPYEKGQINGLAYTYYENEEIKSITPYKSGKIDGNKKEYYENGYIHTQTIYKDGISTGVTRIYAQTGETLFDIKTNSNNKIESGNCYYLDNNNKLVYMPIPTLLIEGLNNNCLETNTAIKQNICSVKELEDMSDCNMTWLEENKKALSKYTPKNEDNSSQDIEENKLGEEEDNGETISQIEEKLHKELNLTTDIEIEDTYIEEEDE